MGYSEHLSAMDNAKIFLDALISSGYLYMRSMVFGSATVLKKHSEGLRQSLPADLDAVLLDGVDHFPPVARLGNLAESMYRKSLLGIAAPDAVVNYFRNLYTSVRAYEKVTGRTITTNG